MNFKCPYCRNDLNLWELTQEDDWRAVIEMMPAFGQNGRLVWAYAEQFGITPLKRHTKKLRLILTEMAQLFRTGTFKFQKKAYRISTGGIAEALGTVAHKTFETSLENHNYLKKIMIDIALREEREAGKRSEEDLRTKEETARTRREHLTDGEIEANRRKLRDLTQGIG